ncbi:PilN domain-containing protein [Angustibacter sp. McL0619]|uniref:PilN domain-containing protein n=1 Tax=Angustibacter sp. McL0619 TaxID=3415676 RepID=UPI003CE7A8DF
MSQTEQTHAVGLDVVSTTGLRLARVNLLPPEIEQGRKLKRTQALLGVGLAAVVVVMAGVYLTQVSDRQKAENELASAKAETVRLQAEQTKYADVPHTIEAIDAAETARSTAMAQDVEWYRTLNNLSLTLPAHVWMTSLNVSVAAPTTAAAGATVTPTTTGIGSVSIQGVAMDHPDVATWLDVLGRQPGMSDAYFSTSAKGLIGETSVVNYSSTATLTQDALSHRYDRKQG